MESSGHTVKAVRKIDRVEKTYNIGTSNHNYFAEGVLVHNCDDGNDPEKVESDVIRASTLKKWRDYSTTRQNDSKTAAVIIVQQRTHTEDITGDELSSESAKDWKVIKLPTVCRKEQEYTFPRSQLRVVRSHEGTKIYDKTGKQIHEIPGAYLHPSRFGKAEDEQARIKLGAYMYSGRHDQEPTALEGGIFSGAVWQRWKELPSNYELALSCDPSFGSTSKTASYVAIGLWAIAFPNFYLIDQFRERCGFSETKAAIRQLIETYQHLGFCNYKLVEKKASGADIIEDLSKEFAGIIPINPQGDKEQRARAIAPYFESANIWLPNIEKIAIDFQDEFTQFPNGSSDDQVDQAGQLILYYAKKSRLRKRSPVASFSIGG